jgi:peptidoglycan-associated lipoprotein
MEHMMNKTFTANSLTVLLIALLFTACSSTPVEEETSDTTTIQESEVTTAVVEAPVQEEVMESEVLADTVFYFDFDKAVLRDESRVALTQHARSLKESPRSIRLEGHADERGTREYNMALGERRAFSVKEFLILEGVSSALIEVISYGEERAAAYGSNDESWAMNRRVELK